MAPPPNKPTTADDRPIRILPVEATEAEIREIDRIRDAAYAQDALMELCFPNDSEIDTEDLLQRNLARIGTPRHLDTKAVDSDGRMVGAALWYWAEDPNTETPEGPWGGWPAGANLACLNAAFGPLRLWRVQHFRERRQPHIYLAMIIVDPQHQRRGIGTALLRHGLAEADRRGYPAFLEASPAGVGLYSKLGWKAKLQTDVNLKDYGGAEDHIESNVAMVRQPYGI